MSIQDQYRFGQKVGREIKAPLLRSKAKGGRQGTNMKEKANPWWFWDRRTTAR